MNSPTPTGTPRGIAVFALLLNFALGCGGVLFAIALFLAEPKAFWLWLAAVSFAIGSILLLSNLASAIQEARYGPIPLAISSRRPLR